MDWSLWSIAVAFWYLGLTALLALAIAGSLAAIFAKPYVDEDTAPGLARRLGQRARAAAALLPDMFVVGLIGALAGGLGGSSRESVVGDLLPAVLTLLGGAFAYFLGAKATADGRLVRNSLAFVLSFFILYNVSAVWRQSSENFEFCKQVYANPDYDDAAKRQERDQLWSAYCAAVFKEWTATE